MSIEAEITQSWSGEAMSVSIPTHDDHSGAVGVGAITPRSYRGSKSVFSEYIKLVKIFS